MQIEDPDGHVLGFGSEPKTDLPFVKTALPAVVAAALAREYGFTDVAGRQPRPLTLEEA
jgi:hypothetical protein